MMVAVVVVVASGRYCRSGDGEHIVNKSNQDLGYENLTIHTRRKNEEDTSGPYNKKKSPTSCMHDDSKSQSSCLCYEYNASYDTR